MKTDEFHVEFTESAMQDRKQRQQPNPMMLLIFGDESLMNFKLRK
jgi:hypothetical protein